MKIRFNGDPVTITHTLTDGEEDQFIRCKIFDNGLNDVTTALSGGPYIFLNHIYRGLYGNPVLTNVPDGHYIVHFEVFRDSLYENQSKKYGIMEEDYFVNRFEERIVAKVDLAEDNLSDTIDFADGSAV